MGFRFLENALNLCIFSHALVPHSKLQAKFCLKSVSPKTKSVEKAMTWSPLKCTFLYFRLLARKLAKFLMSFFKLRVSFPLNFASPYSVMTHNSSNIFYLKYYMLWTKRAHWSEMFSLLSEWANVHQIPYVLFETASQFFWNFASLFSVMRNNSSVLF